MSVRTDDDPTGISIAFVLGLLVGIGLTMPALPPGATLQFGGVEVGPVGSALLAAALAILLLPFGMFALYVLFAAGE